MTYSKSKGGKVRGRKTLRKGKSGKRHGNKKAKRTSRRRKARGGDRSYQRPANVNPLVLNKTRAIAKVENYCLSRDGANIEMCPNTIENIRNSINQAKSIKDILIVLDKNNIPYNDLTLISD